MYRIYNRIGRILADLNMCKRDLADLTGINPNKIGYLVNGFAERVSIIDIARICEVLEVEITDVLELDKGKSLPDPEGRVERILSKVRAVREARSTVSSDRQAMRTTTGKRKSKK